MISISSVKTIVEANEDGRNREKPGDTDAQQQQCQKKIHKQKADRNGDARRRRNPSFLFPSRDSKQLYYGHSLIFFLVFAASCSFFFASSANMATSAKTSGTSTVRTIGGIKYGFDKATAGAKPGLQVPLIH
jgi:hypothetical protein